MNKHTPGPWATAQYSPTDIVVDGDGETMIASARDGLNGIAREQAVANARLIAAAPELLEALQSTLDHLVAVQGHNEGGIQIHIRSAIAKATGE